MRLRPHFFLKLIRRTYIYPLEQFKAYQKESLTPDTQVLVWSRTTGYFFTIAQSGVGSLVIIGVKM